MKSLFLLRHAKSPWGESGAADFDRPLNERGETAATRMGREMRRLGLAFDTVVASPARRVVETIASAEQGYDGRLSPLFEPRIYAASAETLLDLIRATPAKVRSLLLVGHNPGIEQLASMLTEANIAPLRESLALRFPTAGLAEIALPIETWTEAGDGGGTLRRFLRPRDIDP